MLLTSCRGFTHHLTFRSVAWQPPHRALWSEVHVPLEATRQALVHAGRWAVREPGCDICEDEVGGPHPHPWTGRLTPFPVPAHAWEGLLLP